MPTARRLLRAGFLTLGVWLLVGASVGVVQANDGAEASAPPTFVVPYAQAGDEGAYRVTLTGDWSLGTAPTIPDADWQTPYTAMEFSWSVVDQAMDREGRVGPALRLDTDLTIWDLDIFNNEDPWSQRIVSRALEFRANATEPFHGESQSYSVDPVADGLFPVPVTTPGAGDRRLTRSDDYLPYRDCMLTVPLQGHTLGAGDLRVNGSMCQTTFEGHYTPWQFLGYSDFGFWQFLGRQEVNGIEAVGYSMPGSFVDMWFAAGYPVPLRVVYSDVQDREATYDLERFTFGAGGAPGSFLTGGLPPLAMGPRQPYGLDEAGSPLPFTGAEAWDLLLQNATFASFVDGGGYTTFVMAASSDLYGQRNREWIFRLHDGSRELTADARETVPAAFDGLPDVLRSQAAEHTVDVQLGEPEEDGDPFVAPRGTWPDQLPTAGALQGLWSQLGGQGQPNTWFLYAGFDLETAEWFPVVGAGRIDVHHRLADAAFEPNPVAALNSLNVSFDTLATDADGRLVSRSFHLWDTAGEGALVSNPLELDSRVGGEPPQGIAAWLPTPEAAAGAGFVALLIGLLYFLWPKAKAAAGLALFSRITGPKLLEHPARSMLVTLVQAEPGIHYNDLMRRSGLSNGAAMHHLTKLTKGGLLSARPLGRYTCYFPGSSPDRASLASAGALRTEGARRIYEAIQANPGLSGLELATRLGLQPSTIHHHVQRLTEAGLVAAQRDGRALRLHAVAAAS